MKYYYIEEAICNRKQALKTEGHGFDIAGPPSTLSVIQAT